jgi:DNA-binding transcriptional ArsR family regulator
MKNWLKRYREDLAQAVLDVIWEAWSQVGVMGDTKVSATGRIVDPEPLLLLTWQCARQDPRIFDEVLDWLVRNGRWINVVRLSTLLKDDCICEPSVVGAVAAFMMQHDKGPKWRQVAERHRPAALSVPTPLFQRHGKPLAPLADERDETFAQYGWARSPVNLRGQSQPMPAWTPTSLVLKSRAFFGVNIRADVFAWLVAHGQGTASGLARELGYSQRRVSDTLTEMQYAELFQTRFDGYRKEYSLNANKGWQLLFEATTERASWFNWRAFGRAMSVVWRKAFDLKEDVTEYIFEAEMTKALTEAQGDFTAAGLALSTRPGSSELLEKLNKLTSQGKTRV